MRIEPYHPSYLKGIIHLSLRAWAPVFESIQTAMDDAFYQAFYPEHWRVSQQKAVEEVCKAEDTHVWVAVEDDSPAGFVAVKLHEADSMGEIYMVAVDPDFQGQGMGSTLISFALDWMKGAAWLWRWSRRAAMRGMPQPVAPMKRRALSCFRSPDISSSCECIPLVG